MEMARSEPVVVASLLVVLAVSRHLDSPHGQYTFSIVVVNDLLPSFTLAGSLELYTLGASWCHILACDACTVPIGGTWCNNLA